MRMKLRLCHLVVGVLLVHTYAQDPEQRPPLPSPNQELVKQFHLALEAVFGVGIRLQAFLQDDTNENFLVSPISATAIIGQLILGSQGKFQKELVALLALPNSHLYENDLLHMSNPKRNITYRLPYSRLHLQLSLLLKELEDGPAAKNHFILKQKNAAFVNNQIILLDDFKRNLQTFYNAQIQSLDFQNNALEAQRTINQWASKNTNGLIKSILSSPPLSTTGSIFANAIYFKAEWETPFSDMLNRNGPFNVSPTKQVNVTYMINSFDQIMYSESANYRMIALPYTNQELGMYLMLPKDDSPYKYNIKAFVQQLKSREVLATIDKARRRDVVVKIPKMTLSHSFSILDQLKKYRAFKKEPITVNATNAVDKLEDTVATFKNFTKVDQRDIYLTKAATAKNLRVDDIVQQVVISINEKGTEAAAVSASTVDYMGGAKNFIIESPFVFFIRHEATSATLFWGTVSNPAP